MGCGWESDRSNYESPGSISSEKEMGKFNKMEIGRGKSCCVVKAKPPVHRQIDNLTQIDR
jgi:hypothetical protein